MVGTLTKRLTLPEGKRLLAPPAPSAGGAFCISTLFDK